LLIGLILNYQYMRFRRAIHVVWNFSRNNCTSMIKSRENFCLLNVLKSSHISMVVGLRCAVRVHWRFPCDDRRRIPLNTALIFIYYYIISLN
ncbi:hypothetical protein T11_14644, partial [Trichinella zimbabwensis]